MEKMNIRDLLWCNDRGVFHPLLLMSQNNICALGKFFKIFNLWNKSMAFKWKLPYEHFIISVYLLVGIGDSSLLTFFNSSAGKASKFKGIVWQATYR